MRTARLALSVVSSAFVLLACSGNDAPSGFQDPASAPGGDGTAQTPSIAGSSSGSAGSTGAKTACAVASVQGQNLPVRLVIQYDRSSSMKDNGKWDACKAGMADFFALSPQGVSASLSFFPQGSACDAASFKTPQVAMTALPNTTTLKAALDATKLSSGTPTRPALDGALQYAAAQQAANPNTKVVVVLVTDGDPNDCGSTEASVSQVAAASAAKIPTYIIGVGNVTTLNAIAKAGGTKAAVLVDGTNPAKTQADLRAALGEIRSSLTCELVIPTAPAGQTFDKGKVNVVHTQDSVRETLDYDQTCAKPNAWRYDDPVAPTKIEICPNTCSALKDAAGKGTSTVDIELGCETNGPIPK